MQWAWVAAVVLAVGGVSSAADEPSAEAQNRRCLDCHGQTRIAQLPPDQRRLMLAPTLSQGPHAATAPSAPARRPELYLSDDALAASAHAKVACVSCHKTADNLPHPLQLGKPDCTSSCHPKAAGGYLQSAHAAAAARGDPKAPACWTCHGGHDVLSKRKRESRTYPLNIIKICGDCHAQHTTPPDGHDGKGHISSYMESIHGRALNKGGLVVAASCSACHGSHLVLPSKDPRSSVNRQNVAGTCGQCHVGVAETYQFSIHGEQVAKGNVKAPVCSDCHTSHSITRTNAPRFMLDVVDECGQCHDQPPPGSTRRTSLYETYRRSYHGQVNKLGSTRAARCSDCHGAHDIRKLNDPQSRLAPANRVAVCRRCHPDATPKFAQFDPHADFRDSQRNPVLHAAWLYFVIIMSGAFGFFGLHSVLWFVRSVIERIKNGPPPKRLHAGGVAIKRFNRVDRWNHAFVIISFFGLTVTGLPLFYADKAWALAMMDMLGGVRAAGLLHRAFAVILIGNFVVHFVGVARRIRRFGFRKLVFGPATMLPRLKDLKDCSGMFRWFFRGGKKPEFDRWTYWEKFDYTAEVFGSGVIALTGLLLWFPVLGRFLPGWVPEVAFLVHGYEALLAIVFIFTMHFFNAHLRLEKFPVDDVIFTGKLPEEEFKHERAAEYARLEAAGQLENLRTRPPKRWWRIMAICIGVVAMAIGVTLVTLIILAALKWI